MAWRRGLWVALGVALVVFVLVAADVRFDGALSTWDRQVSARIYAAGDIEAREALYDDFLSRPGDDLVVFPLLVVVGLVVAYTDGRWRGALMVGSGFFGGALLKLVKELVGRGRPNVSLLDGPEAFMVVASDRSPSFPSGHVFDTAVIYGLIAWFGLAALMRRRDLPPVVPVIVVAAWVGLSLAMAAFRVLGGVHWVTDVVGSLALAVAWLAATLLVDEHVIRRHLWQSGDESAASSPVA